MPTNGNARGMSAIAPILAQLLAILVLLAMVS